MVGGLVRLRATMVISSEKLGYSTTTFIRKRSTWASGRG